MSTSRRFLLIGVVLVILAPAARPVPAAAVALAQDTIVTLTIVNGSDQAICRVFTTPTGSPDQRVERLNHDTIPAGSRYDLRLPPRTYHVELIACDGRPLLFRSNLPLTESAKLRLAPQDFALAGCYAGNERGRKLYEISLYAEALLEYAAALACFNELEHVAGQGQVLANLGAVYERQGRYGEGIASYRQALTIARNIADDSEESSALNGLATIYADQARYAEALENYHEALALQRKLQNRSGVATLLNNIGVVLTRQKQYAAALGSYQEVLAIQRELGDPRGLAVALHNLATAYNALDEYAEAGQAFADALPIWRELGDRHNEAQTLSGQAYNAARQGRFVTALDLYQQALDIRQAIGDHADEAQDLASRAGIYRDQQRYGEALALYEQAMAALESVRGASGSESGRAGYISRYAKVYSDAIRLYLAQGNKAKAFEVTERGRARAFLDSLTAGQVQLADQENGGGAALGVALSLPAVQDLLNDETTLLSYWMLPAEGALAFIITRAAPPVVVELPGVTREKLLAAISDVYAWPDLEAPHPEALRNLRAWLVDPLADRLKTPRVAIIAHQLIHYVPFSALTDGSRYFGAEHVLFLLPSASALPFITANAARAQATWAHNPLVFGNPAGDGALPPLPAAADEALAIAGTLDTTAYIGANASESRFRSLAGQAGVIHLASHGMYNRASPLYGTVYLAPGEGQDGRLEVREIYGLRLDAAPLVVLSACETNIGELRTEQDIVVSGGDELVGFTRALFFAGSSTVVASLWRVDDVAAKELMVAFYSYLKAGRGKAEALQQAQADVRQTHPSPRDWAGFVLNGDPGSLERPGGTATLLPAKPTPRAEQDFLSCRSGLLLLLVLGGAAVAAGAAAATCRQRRPHRR